MGVKHIRQREHQFKGLEMGACLNECLRNRMEAGMTGADCSRRSVWENEI